MRQFWEEVRVADVDALERLLAPGFQSVRQDGARDRDEELALLATIDIGDSTLTGFVTPRQGATIVVTFMASAKRRSPGHGRQRSLGLEWLPF